MKNIYTNPRTFAAIPDWPYGRKTRTLCTFTVEVLESGGSHKERISKVTVNPNTGRDNKPKKTTFSPAVRIVDGSDGKTYLIQKSGYSMVIYVKKSDFFDFESIHPEDERYAATLALFNFRCCNGKADHLPSCIEAVERHQRETLEHQWEIDHNQRQEGEVPDVPIDQMKGRW